MPRAELGNVIVTGGASGLGAAVADAVFAAGGVPVVLDLNPGPDWCESEIVDLADGRAAEAAVDRVAGRLGALDGVVAAAGIDACGDLSAVDAEAWERVIAVNLLGTAAVLQACAVVLTHDSGLLHVAEAVGRPVVALFGPTVPQFGYAPYLPHSLLLQSRPPCSPCSKNGSRPCRRPTHECMDNLTVDAVRAAVDAVLQTTPDPAGA